MPKTTNTNRIWLVEDSTSMKTKTWRWMALGLENNIFYRWFNISEDLVNINHTFFWAWKIAKTPNQLFSLEIFVCSFVDSHIAVRVCVLISYSSHTIASEYTKRYPWGERRSLIPNSISALVGSCIVRIHRYWEYSAVIVLSL